MQEVEALPFVHYLARSDRPADRALFARVYRDLAAELGRRGEVAPASWVASWRACIGMASPDERELYSTELARACLKAPGRPDIEAILDHGDDAQRLALAGDRHARLKTEHVAALALRARRLAQDGDRRLAEAVLAREPIRLEAAPLFLEASRAQRREILLAAQRADLGRNRGAAPKMDEDLVGQLEFTAIAGAANEFAEALAGALGVETELAARIAADPDGEPLAVALVALGAPYDLAVRVMTARDLSEEGDGFSRVHTLARLGDRLTPAAARRIVAAMTGREFEPATAAIPAAPARQAAEPSPFARREGSRRAAVSPETPAASARNSRAP